MIPGTLVLNMVSAETGEFTGQLWRAHKKTAHPNELMVQIKWNSERISWEWLSNLLVL